MTLTALPACSLQTTRSWYRAIQGIPTSSTSHERLHLQVPDEESWEAISEDSHRPDPMAIDPATRHRLRGTKGDAVYKSYDGATVGPAEDGWTSDDHLCREPARVRPER